MCIRDRYILLQGNVSADIQHTLLSTHVQLTSSACASPTDESVSEAIQWDCNTTTSRLRPAEWKLDAQNYWTCHACMDDLRHQSQSLSDTAWGTPSSVLSPTTPLEDHSALSTVTTSFEFHLQFSPYFRIDFICHSLYTKYLLIFTRSTFVLYIRCILYRPILLIQFNFSQPIFLWYFDSVGWVFWPVRLTPR